jgi:hypothetical protein
MLQPRSLKAGFEDDADATQTSVDDSSSQIGHPNISSPSIDESRDEQCNVGGTATPEYEGESLPGSLVKSSKSSASLRSVEVSQPHFSHDGNADSKGFEGQNETESVLSRSSLKVTSPFKDGIYPATSQNSSMASCNDSVINSNEADCNPTSTPNQDVIDQSESFVSKSSVISFGHGKDAIVKAGSYMSADASITSDDKYGLEPQQSNDSPLHQNKPQVSLLPNVIIRQSGSHVSASLAEKACYSSDEDTMPTLMSSESPSSHASSIPPPLMSFDSMASSRRSKYSPTVSESPSSSTLHLKKPPPSPRNHARNGQPLMRSNSKEKVNTLDESSRSHTSNATPPLKTSDSTVSSRKSNLSNASDNMEMCTKDLKSKGNISIHSARTVPPPLHTTKPPASPFNPHSVQEPSSTVGDSLRNIGVASFENGKDAGITTESSAQRNNCVDAIKALGSPVSAASNVGDRYGVVTQLTDVSSVKSNRNSPLQYQDIIRESGSHVSVSLCDHDASTASINNTLSRESLSFQGSNEVKDNTSLLEKFHSNASFKMSRSLSSLDIIRDLESHDVTSVHWKTRPASPQAIIAEQRSSTSNDENDRNANCPTNSPEAIQLPKPAPSPRNQLILNEFKSRLNLMSSTRSQNSIAASESPNAVECATCQVESTHSCVEKTLTSYENEEDDTVMHNEYKSRLSLLSSFRSLKSVRASQSLRAVDDATSQVESTYSCVEKTLTSYEKEEDDTIASLESFESTHVCPPSLKSFEGLIDDADESILDTVMCQRFIQAFESTLTSNPGMLPGDLSLISNLEHTLAKLTRAKDEQEYQMKGRILRFQNEKFDIESSLNAKKGLIGENTDDLAEQLAKAEQEKDLIQHELDQLLSDVQATKCAVEQKRLEADSEDEDLKKHLSHLTASHEQIKASLESETTLLEEERATLEQVNDTRRTISAQKNDNKELEKQIELMTESISRDKTSLQCQAAELKDFEEKLAQLRLSNKDTQKDLEDERKEILATTLRLQQRRQALIQSKAELESNLKKEKEDIEHKIDESRMMRSRDLKKIAKRKFGGGINIEAMIEARISAEVKKKRQELERREKDAIDQTFELNGELNTTNSEECNPDETKMPSLLTETMTGEIEIEAIVKSRVDATLKRKELELRTIEELSSQSSSQLMASSTSTEEVRNTSSRHNKGEISVCSDDGTIGAESFTSSARSKDSAERKPIILQRTKSFTPAEVTSDRYDCKERTKVDHLQRSRSFNPL